MNPRIYYIATNTFREAVRDRVLYNLIAFALLLSGAAVLVGREALRKRQCLGRGANYRNRRLGRVRPAGLSTAHAR